MSIAGSARGAEDTLGDFEREIEDREDEQHESETTRPDYDDEDDAAGRAFGSLIAVALRGATSTSEHYGDRRKGAPSVALVRLETVYQPLTNTDVDGYAGRGELVWSFIGIGGEFIGYREDSPSSTLDFGTAEALLRIAPTDTVRLTLAAGTRVVSGRRTRAGFEGGFSVGIYPTRWLGLEADLRWADIVDRTLGDYRAGVLLRLPGFPYVAVRGGYRAIQYRGETLDGAEMGLVLTW